MAFSDPQEVRAEHVISLPPGTVLADEKGSDWIFMGWTRNTAGLQMCWSRVLKGEWSHTHPGNIMSWGYTVALAHTALRKFPALKDWIKDAPAD